MSHDPLITLTTDFGYDDPFVGVMKGVILKINPMARIVDLTHGIKPYDIMSASFAIGANFRYFPADTIHLVVVDPGVGSSRRPVMVMTDNHYFVGPDNGVFTHVYAARPDMLRVVHITARHYFLSPGGPTFQGRDVFAPVAAWFSRGISMSKFGEPVDDYQKISLPVPSLTPEGALKGEVVYIDRFGNAITNVTAEDLRALTGEDKTASVHIRVRDKVVPLREFYEQGVAGELCALVNSSDLLELFIYRDSAASDLGVEVGDPVEVILIFPS